jgi:glycine dehydrogenase subunit 1
LPSIPYIPNTEHDQRVLLDAIGAASIEELFDDIPSELRNPVLNLPPPLSEIELRREFQRLSAESANVEEYACFLGGGAYRHYIPATVWRLAQLSGLATSYTPYQAEISQGVLQTTYEFQGLVCQLLGMEVSNAGMYDGATALAEAALMACRLTGRSIVAAEASVAPRYLDVVRTYVTPQGIEVADSSEVGEDVACVLAQSPNFFGYVEDVEALVGRAHRAGALAVVATDPIAAGLLRPPGEYGADIVVAEGQPLGIPLSFGGPYLGLFCCKTEHLRQMPGRIVGATVDGNGKRGYVLTLQTREQHIRRERATSNICTSESLAATAATIYMASMGKPGMRQVAELCYHKAHYAASRIAELPGYSLAFEGLFFKEFVVRCPRSPSEINRGLAERRIIGGLDISAQVENGMLLCVTEMISRDDIDALVDGLVQVGPA